MLVINAVLTLRATITIKQNQHLISLKTDSDAQYWELWINTHTAAPLDQNQATTTELSSAIYQSMTKINS